LKSLPKYFLPFLFFYSFFAKAQLPEILNYDYGGRPELIGRIVLKKPFLLVDKLTNGKNTDGEKFQSIYNWVAKNIDFDFRYYYASGVFPQPDLVKILKRKMANAFEYAFLMDTFCYMAGIKNVSLYGYVKDLLSDVNDSLYNDTHAWNAVNLDNSWYLYDITFSKGFLYYRYTKFSQFIVYLKNKFTVRYVPKKVKEKKTKYLRHAACGGFVVSEGKGNKITVLKAVSKHKLLRKFLSRFRIKLIRDYKKESTTKYFLTEPELFAVTHCPDNPDWSMISGRSRMQYERDSSYYHLTDTLYSLQKRHGSVCPDCEGYLLMDDLNKTFYYRKKSMTFNDRNGYTPSECEYKIACLKFEESKKSEDSLTKITLLDTALAFIQHAKSNFLQASNNLSTSRYLQSIKNSKKLSDLIDDNKLHSRFIRSKMELSFQETRNIRDLENKLETDAKKFYFRNRVIDHYREGKEIDRDVQRIELTIKYLKSQVIYKMSSIDSLNNLIKNLRQQFSEALPDLNKNLMKKIVNHDSLLIPLQKSMQYRNDFLDSYKKRIVEVRKQMYVFEKNYSSEIDSIIYKPADFCYETGKRISSLIDERNQMRQESYRLRCQLVKFSEIEPGNIDAYKEELKNENQEDLCWINGNNRYLQAIFYGFRTLLAKQSVFDGMLYQENKIEVCRYMITNYELGRRKRNYQKIISGSRKTVNVKNREIKRIKVTI